MVVVEKFLRARTDDISTCEDAIYVNGDFACVIDGATSQSNLQWEEMRPGRFASKLILEGIESFSKMITDDQAVEKLTGIIATEYRKRSMYEHMRKNASDRLAASMVMYSNYLSEIWMLGECQCALDGNVIVNRNPFSDLLAEVRSLYLKIELSSGMTVDELVELDTGRKYILPLLRGQSLFQNKPGTKFAYGVLDGFDLDRQFIKRIAVPEETQSIVLASDGYPLLLSTLEETEGALRTITQEDPLLIEAYKSTKGMTRSGSSFDDRAYLKIDL